MIALGPFDLDHRIGRGGMAEVWAGRHRGQGVDVAVKVITRRDVRAAALAAALRHEVRTMARLEHPSILLVFDQGEVTADEERVSGGKLCAGSPYLVMERAPDGTVAPLCGQLSWRRVRRVLLDLLDALGHAHARGVIHRDVKPTNVLLFGRHAKLSDFGVALEIELEESSPWSGGNLQGTPAYMAPEQFAGRTRLCSPATDLYALGCVAHSLVCGRPPYGVWSDLALMWRLHSEGLLAPLDARLPLPDGFESWVRRLLAKHPSRRFQRAADAATALRNLGNPPEPAQVRPLEGRSERGAGLVAAAAATTSGTVPDGAGAAAAAAAGLGDTGVHGPRATAEASGLSRGEQHDSIGEPNRIGATAPQPGPSGSGLFSADLEQELRVLHEEPTVRATMGALDAWTIERAARTDTIPSIVPLPDFPPTWREPGRRRPPMGLVGAGLSLYGLRAIPMVGREDERDELWATLRAVSRRRLCRLVLLEGPAGCGKTRLAQWLCERAHESGVADVLRAVHSSGAGPLDGLGPMVAQYLRALGLPRGELSAHLTTALAEHGINDQHDIDALVELLDPSADSGKTIAGPVVRFGTASERYALLARLIDRLCVRRPAILWLEDAQWAEDALGFADYLLGRRETRLPVLLVLTARSETLAERPGVAAMIDALVERPEGLRLTVGPLPMDEWPRLVERLLRLDGALAARVAERTRGHPLHAVQIVGDWVDRGLLEPADGGFRLRAGERVELPNELHELWSARLDRALEARPSSDALAIELGAALGADVDEGEWRECCALAGITPSDGLVEDLVSRRLAREAEQGIDRGWSFVHAMLRESVERRSQEQGRAQDHHATCARMLRSREGVGLATRLGRHLVAAGEAEQALGPLRFGAHERLARGDYVAAEAVVSEIEEVLRELGRPADDPSWGDCWILRARIGLKRGRFDDATRWAGRALEAAERPGWSHVAVEALLVAGTLQRLTGATAAALEQLTAARDRARALRQDRLLAEALDALGRVLMHRGELHAAEECWHEARGLYLAMRDRVGAASALWALAHVATYGTKLDVAQRYNDRALAELRQLGDRWGVGRCLNSAGEIARLRGELEAAEEHYRDAGEIMHALGAEDSASICEANVARVLVERECYQEARVQLEVSVRDFEQQHRHNALSWALTVLLVCCAAEGDWEQWHRNMARVRELLAESAYLDLDIAEVATMAGRIALARGGLEQAREAWELARAQWQGLGRQERVEALEPELRALEI